METSPPGQPRYSDRRVILTAVGIAVVGALGLLLSLATFLLLTSILSWLGLFPPIFPAARPVAPTAVAHVPGEIWGVPVSEYTASSGRAYRTWVSALMSNDAAAALELYRPAGGGDPAADVQGYIAELRALRPRTGPRGPLGRLVKVRDAGEYAGPAESGTRYAVTKLIFERGEACFRGELGETGDGWHVRGWGRLSDAECEEALVRIAGVQR